MAKQYEHVSYPSWRYHPTEKAKIVTEAQDAGLDAAWRDTPYEPVSEPKADVPESPLVVSDDVSVSQPDGDFATPVELVAAAKGRRKTPKAAV